jgi:xylulokinase
MNYMGIDIGTGSCKAVVFDKSGRQLASASREYNVIFSDDGGAELDSDKVIESCFEVIKQSTGQVEHASVGGLGISSQGEAFTVIGRENESLCNAMVSSDSRSQAYIRKWYQNFDENRLYQITGHTAHSMFTLFKLLWLKDNQPEIWSKARKFLCFEDLLQFRLGLEPSISWSLAGRTMLFDVRKHEWNDDILNTVKISVDQLAKAQPSGTIIGRIDREISRNLGLKDDTFVVTGGHDQPCGALGAGVTKPGMGMYATGSVECITPAMDQPIFKKELSTSNLCTYDHAITGMYVTVAFSLTGGNILKWFRDEFGGQEVNESKRTGVDTYDLILKSIGDQPSNLLVLPYFTPSGTPYFDTETKGAVLGLRLSTRRSEFIRALLEGVTFEMRLNLEILEKSGYKIDELRVIGGGAKSPVWTQLKADITGKKMKTLGITEAGCLGVAMLACAADLGISVRELTDKWIQPLAEIYPQEKNSDFYDEKFSHYKDLFFQVQKIRI